MEDQLMRCLLAGGLGLALVLAFGSGTPADDKKDKDKPALSGTWVREANGLDLKFEFKDKDILEITVAAGDNGVVAICKYTVDKEGIVKGKITEVKEKGNFPGKPPKDFEFSFKWK